MSVVADGPDVPDVPDVPDKLRRRIDGMFHVKHLGMRCASGWGIAAPILDTREFPLGPH